LRAVVIKRRKKKLLEENSVLNDLAFLLIIYFIVISGFNINKGFLMNIPASDSVRLIAKDDILRYELNETGIILFNGSPVEINTVEKNVAANISHNPNLALMLTISPNAPWQNVVSFVELAQKLRVESFSFRMKEMKP
jgi:biopolymer transport protein ExbD